MQPLPHEALTGAKQLYVTHICHPSVLYGNRLWAKAQLIGHSPGVLWQPQVDLGEPLSTRVVWPASIHVSIALPRVCSE